jgi:hypothetical protein
MVKRVIIQAIMHPNFEQKQATPAEMRIPAHLRWYQVPMFNHQ